MKLINSQVLKSTNFIALMKLLKKHNNINKIISYHDFSRLVQLVVEEIMEITLQKVGYPNELYSCQINTMKLSRRGSFNYFNNRLTLNEDVIYNLYCGNVLELLTILHELNHFKLKYDLITGKISLHLVRVLKEKLLRQLGKIKPNKMAIPNKNIDLILMNSFETYYKDNYDLFSEEKLASIRAIKDFTYVIDNFGIKLSKTQLSIVQNELEQEKKDYQNYLRDVRYNSNFNSNFIDFEEAFDIMIKYYPEWLRFPQLQIEYYLDEFGNVRKRNKDELLEILTKEIKPEKQKYIKRLLKENINKRLDKSVFMLEADKRVAINKTHHSKIRKIVLPIIKNT